MRVVRKFGGASVGSPEKILNVAGRCIEDYQKGNDVVVVLSAMDQSTDELISLARQVNPRPGKRELDMLMATGEQVSVAMMAMAMDRLGVRAVSLNAFQVPMRTTSAYGSARIRRIERERILHELEDRKIVIVTGFQGINKYGDITTLGRGGSDTTAVAIAASIRADLCEIYTDVDGVYTADPRICKNARKLKEITYDEMLDLSMLGAGVLHNRSVELAKKYGVTLVVRSSYNHSEGTILREDTKMERMLISGVALDKSADRISVLGLRDEPGIAFRLFDTIAKANVNVDVIVQATGRDGTKDISFTCPDESVQDALDALKRDEARLGYRRVDVKTDIAKLSIVGSGMMSNPGVAARMFEALYNEDINIDMISTSEIRITVLVDESDGERAVNAVHDAFGLVE